MRSCAVGVPLIVLLGAVLATSGSVQKSSGSGFGIVPTQAIEAKQKLETKTRKVDRQRGRPITDVLQPTDEVVEIVEWQPAGVPPLPPQGRTQLQQMTFEASAVFVVTVDSVTGTVSPEGDWIESSVVAAVSEVLKNSEPPSQPGHLLTFGATGGEIAIGSQKIRASLPESVPFKTGRSYLVFLPERGNELWVYPAEAAVIEGTKLVPLSPEGQRNFLYGDKHHVLKQIAAFVGARE